jgi:hypothetical protein
MIKETNNDGVEDDRPKIIDKGLVSQGIGRFENDPESGTEGVRGVMDSRLRWQ